MLIFWKFPTKKNPLGECHYFLMPAHHGQIDLNKILGTVEGTHQTSKWTPLGSQITEN